MGKQRWDYQWDCALVAAYPAHNLRELGLLFGVSAATVMVHGDRLGLPRKPRVIGIQKHASPMACWDARRPHEFSTKVKQLRFQEEHGVCQHCHKSIGDGTRWHDRGPGALVTYHHIKMVCEGGDGSPENCMVLHKGCHGGRGTGKPLNRELHHGRNIDYTYTTVFGPKRLALSAGGRTKRNTLTWTDSELIQACSTAKSLRDVMRALGYQAVRGESTYRVQDAMQRLGLHLNTPPPLPKRVLCHMCQTPTTPSKNNKQGPWFCSKRCVGLHSRNHAPVGELV